MVVDMISELMFSREVECNRLRELQRAVISDLADLDRKKKALTSELRLHTKRVNRLKAEWGKLSRCDVDNFRGTTRVIDSIMRPENQRPWWRVW